MLKILKLALCLSLTLVCSCAYRFTNKYIYPPDGAKTIAIAPIFDSSRMVFPHDVLWYSLQQAFASSGHLNLTSASKADLFLQAHVKGAASSEYESDAISKLPNPNMFLNPDNGQPYSPRNYVDLHAADNYSKRERLSVTVLVEIWDLRNKTLMLRKEYFLASNFNMMTIQFKPEESHYIRNEENAELMVVSLARDFAKNVVTDLFLTPYFAKKSPKPRIKSRNDLP